MYSSLLLAGVVGCGGGAGTDNRAVEAADTNATAAASDVPDRTAAGVSALQGVSVAPPPTRRVAVRAALPSPNGLAVGSWRQLNAFAGFAVNGVPEVPQLTANKSAAPGGLTFYVDSNIGNDLNNGRAPVAQGSGTGPWRTLGRLMQANLKPGDTVQLACGGSWQETLRLPGNGTLAQPIRVVAPTGCALPPAIDGSVAISPESWKPYKGNIYQTSLGQAPLLLTTPPGTLTEAHHPNTVTVNGVVGSPYLKFAENGNVATVNGRTGSTTLPTGTGLVVPVGTDLANGARIRVRSEPYVIDETWVQSFNGKSLTISRPTSAPVRSGSGYFLLGQLWMLDSAGEWHYDAPSRQLYVWMPDSLLPRTQVNASVLGVGVDLSGRQHVMLEGLAIKNVGLGLDLRKSVNIQVRSSTVEDIADIGINASASTQVMVESNAFARIGTDAITGQGDPIAYATELTVRNNLIRDSGVIVKDDNVISLPRRSLAAIVGSPGAVITGNTVINTGYIGILAVQQSTVEGNFVFGACSVQDDCGGIYTGGANNNSKIRGNTVARSRGMLYGISNDTLHTSAQGIYVDDQGSGVVIEGNTVVDTDFGIHLHNAAGNTVRNNQLYANRRAQIWLQEDSKSANQKGDLFGNVISSNLLAPTSAEALGIFLTSAFDSTVRFATFDNNRYLDRYSSKVAFAGAGSGSGSYSFAQWAAIDQNAWGSSAKAETAYLVSGTNLLGGTAASAGNTGGWYSWNATAPAGKLFSEACSAGTCLRYVAGGSAGVVSSPGFTVKQGNWYRINMDLATEQDNQAVPLVVRIGGADYASVSDRNLNFTAGRTLKRYSQVFQATRTVDPTSGLTGSLKARIDIDGVDGGRSVSLSNVEIVQVIPPATPSQSVSLLNAGTSAASLACPLSATSPASCQRLYNLADDKLVNWPLLLPARSALVLYTKE